MAANGVVAACYSETRFEMIRFSFAGCIVTRIITFWNFKSIFLAEKHSAFDIKILLEEGTVVCIS